MIGKDGRMTEVSDRWLERVGNQREEVLGRRSIEFLAEGYREEVTNVDLPPRRLLGHTRTVLRKVRDGGQAQRDGPWYLLGKAHWRNH
jgi:PAS domain S-box-containing protein